MNPYEPVYRAAHYCVSASPAFVLRIGEHSSPLEHLYRQHAVHTAAFVTAWNPYSRVLPEAENRQRNAQLAAAIRAAGFHCIHGIGKSPDGEWVGEESFLVPGISREAAAGLGRQFGQHAIVFCDESAVPELVWMSIQGVANSF